ncbi:hypothetical protein [Dipodfec virus UOA04_Rod_567]|nr:hypothetical protein [Dipodfec virus UOA04_Rod_567]
MKFLYCSIASVLAAAYKVVTFFSSLISLFRSSFASDPSADSSVEYSADKEAGGRTGGRVSPPVERSETPADS